MQKYSEKFRNGYYPVKLAAFFKTAYFREFYEIAASEFNAAIKPYFNFEFIFNSSNSWGISPLKFC